MERTRSSRPALGEILQSGCYHVDETAIVAQVVRAQLAPGGDRMVGILKKLLAWLAYRVNDVFPNAESLVSKSLHRFVLLRENPERLFLQNEALPWGRLESP